MDPNGQRAIENASGTTATSPPRGKRKKTSKSDNIIHLCGPPTWSTTSDSVLSRSHYKRRTGVAQRHCRRANSHQSSKRKKTGSRTRNLSTVCKSLRTHYADIVNVGPSARTTTTTTTAETTAKKKTKRCFTSP